MRARPDVIVIGAGVSGLSSAIRLAEAGLAVEIVARELPLRTNSCAAAAMWAPYLVTDPRLRAWSLRTHEVLTGFAPADGVRRVLGREVAQFHQEAPDWMRGLPRHRACESAEVPAGFTNGWWYETPVVDMPVYLATLTASLEPLGIRLVEGVVESFAAAHERAPIVVNCSGVEARRLVADDDLSPVRGQLLVVENPGITEFFAEHDDSPAPTYFVPHGDRLVLGGSIEPDRAERTADTTTAVAIQQRCARIEPAIAGARVLDHRVGIRPHRSEVRLERTTVPSGPVVHNYGHGGAGVTMSWGCAEAVRDLVQDLARAVA
jgi:D-amino-acid oxidase